MAHHPPYTRNCKIIIYLYACMSTAGPRYLSALHQYEGQEVEQHAHKMHSYIPYHRNKRKTIRIS